MARWEWSAWALVCAVGAVAVLAVATQAPWFTYKSTTASQSPPGGPTGEADTSVKRMTLSFYPFETRGNASAAGNATVQEAQGRLGGLVLTAGIAAALVPVFDLTLGWWRPTRYLSLLAGLVALAATAGALLFVWFGVPDSMAADGVTGPFTSERTGDVYVRTYIDAGWLVAAGAVILEFALLGFRYAAGAADAAAVEEYRARKETV